MVEVTIKELVKQAKKDEEKKEKLIKIYIDKYLYFSERNSNVRDIESKYPKLMRLIIEEYLSLDNNYDICNYINPKLKAIEKKQAWDIESSDELNFPVTYLFKKAVNGDKEAKDKLVVKYMHIVEDALKDIKNPYIEHEDALQMGYILLLKSINNHINKGKAFDSSYLSEKIHNYMNTCYGPNINKANKGEKKYLDEKEVEIGEDALSEFIFLQEFNDFMDNNNTLTEKEKFVWYEVIEGYSQTETAKEVGVSKSCINGKIKKSKVKMKTFINIK